jgi:hypothetical protein
MTREPRPVRGGRRVELALLPARIKALAAVVVVGALSALVILLDLTDEAYSGLVKAYGAGTLAGLCASLAAAFMIRRRTAHVRAKTLALTLGLLFAGTALLASQPVSTFLFGPGTRDSGMLVFNYALGYFAPGVAIDALRVRAALKSQKGTDRTR